LRACFTQCNEPTENSADVPDGAYRLRTDGPVTVYQFSPLGESVNADASLLLPRTALGTDYVVAAWQASPHCTGGTCVAPGFLAVVATADNTQVNFTLTASVIGENGAPPFTAGIQRTLVMNRGEVVELFNYIGDLSGSIITSDQPI